MSLSGLVRFCVAPAAALTLAASPAAAQAQLSARVRAPQVPVNLEVPDGHEVYEKGHAVGTQNYICLLTATGMAWTFLAPEATLFDSFKGRQGQQTMTHFLSQNPNEVEMLRPTWQDSSDSSRVWARAMASSIDPQYVKAGAIAWLLLEVLDTGRGPSHGGNLTRTTFIHRVNTSGGVKPTTGCVLNEEIGKLKLVPYETDYYFYRAERRHR